MRGLQVLRGHRTQWYVGVSGVIRVYGEEGREEAWESRGLWVIMFAHLHVTVSTAAGD